MAASLTTTSSGERVTIPDRQSPGNTAVTLGTAWIRGGGALPVSAEALCRFKVGGTVVGVGQAAGLAATAAAASARSPWA